MKGCPKPLRITGMLGCHLDCLNVLSLPALLALGHVELHPLPFLQAAEAASLNCREMHEDIFSSLAADEAIAFGVSKRHSHLLRTRFSCSVRAFVAS